MSKLTVTFDERRIESDVRTILDQHAAYPSRYLVDDLVQYIGGCQLDYLPPREVQEVIE